jgi:hypothetical protein
MHFLFDGAGVAQSVALRAVNRLRAGLPLRGLTPASYPMGTGGSFLIGKAVGA